MNSGIFHSRKTVRAYIGYVVLMQWPHNNHATALTAYAAVIVLFLLLGLIAQLREGKQKA